jgi:hypothetical protein
MTGTGLAAACTSGNSRHQRAYDWAQQWPRLQGKDFAVVGAILQLGNCLDLLDTDHTRRLSDFAKAYLGSGRVLPPNTGAKRLGDCCLINSFCEELADDAPIDTVRGLFQEGAPITEGSEILLQNHIQVVARRPSAIIGLFRPRAFIDWAGPVAMGRAKGKLPAMADKPERVIVDPAVQEAEDAFQRMMARFRAKTPEEHLRFGIERGLLNPDGSPKLPEGDPCVTILR